MSTATAVQQIARQELGSVDTNVGFAQAVLDGTVPGEFWCDRDSDPQAFHVVHPCGMSLLWGPGVSAVLDVVVTRLLEREPEEWLQIDPRWHAVDWNTLLGAVAEDLQPDPQGETPAVTRHTRVNFSFDPADGLQTASQRMPPVGWQCRRATAAEYSLQGTVVPGEYWPDSRSFLNNGGGVVAECAGEVGAIAFTSFHWADNVEIGVETVSGFRRRGLARVAAARLISDLVAEGSRPVWSCRSVNTGSFRLAQQLGFAHPVGSPYFHLARTPDAS